MTTNWRDKTLIDCIYTENLTKNYGTVKAIDNLDLCVHTGEKAEWGTVCGNDERFGKTC